MQKKKSNSIRIPKIYTYIIFSVLCIIFMTCLAYVSVKYYKPVSIIENEKSISINYDELSFSIKNVLENYRNTNDILLKNHLLKSVIEEVIYFKEKGKRNAKFEIDIKLKI